MEKRKNVMKRKNMEKKYSSNRKMRMSLLISPLVLSGILLAGIQATQASEADGKWEARSIEQIKKDVEGKKEYTIVWGDTLSGISLATNVTMEKLASLNGIGNYNLIYAGNKLVFEGNVVTVQDQNGVVTDQQQINKSDKIVPNQPIGESVGQASQTPSKSNTQEQDQTNNEASDTTSIPSSNEASNNDGTSGNGSSSGGTSNGGGVTNPTPNPTPDPAPTPTPIPEPQVQYTVWFY
ncbi:MAG: LysM peptidoglycan-binding domain-containing protein, partial [Enterococcus sp.]